jgi:hypothetical protein
MKAPATTITAAPAQTKASGNSPKTTRPNNDEPTICQ